MRVAHRRRAGNGRTSVRGGFVNHIIALNQLQNDGLLTIEDGDAEWQWPDD